MIESLIKLARPGQVLSRHLRYNPHHSNNNKPLTIDELIQALITIKHRVKAIVYTRKFGTKELFEVIWKSTGILTINIRTHLLSKRKQNSNRYKHQLLENYPEVEIECSLLKIVIDHQKNLRRLTLKKKISNTQTALQKTPWKSTKKQVKVSVTQLSFPFFLR